MIAIMSGVLGILFDGASTVQPGPFQVLFLTGDPVVSVHLVLSGRVALLRRAANGATLRLQEAGPGEVLAEAAAWSPRYHCDAEALEPATLAALPVALFRARLAESPALAEAWTRYLAHAVQAARFRAGLMSLRGVADRLDAWLAEGHELPPLGRIQTLAADLGVTREALYRELSRRRNMVDRFGEKNFKTLKI
jgi:CRP-like cAMP-binding protein